MKATAFLKYLREQPAYRDRVVHIEAIPPRRASYAELEQPLPAALNASLQSRRQLPLYHHQAEAVNLARRGHHVLVATASASGKTLCYNLPVLEMILNEPAGTALYLFPTKALAQDQTRRLKEIGYPALLALTQFATFDGDTPAAERAEIRKRGRIILTNPDMLHLGILPNHQRWSRFLRHLRYVVIDEAHSYRGVFGSHVSGVLRRLRRLCRHYGSNPQFIGCSATIANPGEHIQKLVGLPFEVVTSDGSPSGGKDFVFWNPPLLDDARSERRSANGEATSLFTELVSHDIRTITFAQSRRLTELIYIYTRQKLAETNPILTASIKPYRAGYLPEERRQIERELFQGKLRGVVATNALELGVDIGDLDATVLTGYPGSIASTWQQAGRSGRGQRRSLSFLIGRQDPLDQYFMHHPSSFFGQSFENALLNPENPYILRAHLTCAAWEKPLDEEDEAYFGSAMAEVIATLSEQGILRARKRQWYPAPSIFHPARSVSIRATAGEHYRLIDATTNSLLETIDPSVAFFQIHPGAVYLHQGESYLVEELDLKERTARAKPTQVPYYTQTKDFTDLRVVRLLRRKIRGTVGICLGEVAVTTTVAGYKKIAPFNGEVIGEEPLELPPQHFSTIALWFDLPADTMARLEAKHLDLSGGLHAAEHAAIAILPLFALCDRNDIGGVSTPHHPDTGRAQIFIYDAYPGGIGIAEKGYQLIEALWRATLATIRQCPCQTGCPACIQSPKCGNNNVPLDKKAAEMLLAGLLARETVC